MKQKSENPHWWGDVFISLTEDGKKLFQFYKQYDEIKEIFKEYN